MLLREVGKVLKSNTTYEEMTRTAQLIAEELAAVKDPDSAEEFLSYVLDCNIVISEHGYTRGFEIQRTPGLWIVTRLNLLYMFWVGEMIVFEIQGEALQGLRILEDYLAEIYSGRWKQEKVKE